MKNRKKLHQRHQELEAVQRAAVVAEAITWIDTPVQHQQSLKGVAVDCGYLPARIYETVLGWPRCDFGNYPQAWMLHTDNHIYLEWARKLCGQVDQPQPGDLALFQYGRSFSHGAIVTKWPEVIHADSRYGHSFVSREQNVTRGPLRTHKVIFFSPWAKQAAV